MSRELFSNNASTTVSSGGTGAPAAGTVETWTVLSASTFPVASNTGTPPTQFRVVDPAAPTEWMLVTNTSGNTWTVTRGIEGTPVAHSAGFTVKDVVTGAVLTGWSLNSPWFNVLDYGADPTGTVDSAPAINAACLDATAVGGTVLIPRGDYKVMSGIVVLDNTTIWAYGAYIFAGATSFALLWNYIELSSPTVYTGHSNITVLGGIWDNKGQVYTGGSTDTMFFNHARNITIRDLTIRNTQFFHGIEFNAINGGQIVNCRFEGAQQGAGTENLEAIQIDVAFTGAGEPANDNTMSQNILIMGNYVGPATDGSGLGAPGWVVAAHSSQGDQYFHNIKVIGNTADSTLYGGYHVYCWGEAVLTGNLAINCTGPGILVEPQSSGGYHLKNFAITGNIFSGCTGSGVSLAGLDASDNITDVTVSGNEIVNCGGGINAQWTNGLAISGNMIDNCGAGMVIGHSTDVVATGNTITTATYGIDSVSVVQFNYSNNDINGASSAGMYLSGGGNGVICNNIISNAVIGIDSPSGCTTVMCADNEIIQGTGGLQGILVQTTSTGWTVHGNDVSNGTWTPANAFGVVAGTVVTDSGLTGVRGDNVVGTALNPKAVTASLASFTAEAVVATFTLPANEAVAGGHYRFKVFGTAASSGTPTYTFRVRFGGLSGTGLASFAGVVTATGVSSAGWEIAGELYFTAVGSSGTLACSNSLRQQIASTTPPAVAVTNLSDGAFGSINTTVSNTLVVTVQSSASSASNVVASTFGTLERVY